MKEITRRLYTKPVMLGMAFLVGMALVVGLFVTTRSTAAFADIPAGNDEFETTANGESYHDFGNGKIPANFFGAGSQEFGEVVAMEGVPLAPPSNIDTIIERKNTIPVGGTTPIQMTALSLKSINPITVHYASSTESWNVFVGLSLYKSSTGSMTINASTFDSTLKVWPRFTFKRIPDNKTLVYDTGNPTGPGLTAASETPTMAFEDAVALPAPTVAPCTDNAVQDFESRSATTSAAATSSCAPLTLTTTSSPWVPCPPGFCIPKPITEAERWAAHNASPPGTKKVVIQAGGVSFSNQ
ncbi:MAG TPA: hypothetical protein VJR02_28245 [Pyrinomonadaceae bacterium]|nr:hypothetical protein [Pyrinomonadaceae bacterium]